MKPLEVYYRNLKLYTPVLDDSRDFFVDVMGLREVHRDDSYYRNL